MWNAAGDQQDTSAVIPDSSLRRRLRRGRRRLPGPRRVRPGDDGLGAERRAHGAAGRGVRLARQDVRDPGDGHRAGRRRAPARSLLEHEVEAGDIWRACQVKDAPIRDWVRPRGPAGPAPGAPVVFWLDETRAHDAQLIAKVAAVPAPSTTPTACRSRSWRRPRPRRFSLERIRRGEDTISVTGNVLRDYLTDLFPIMELGTSAKMLSIVPLMNGGGLFETGAGGSAPKHVQQFVKENHLRWDSLGEFLALAASLELLAETTDNATRASCSPTRSTAPPARVLDENRSPSRKVGELDNRGSHFYLALYWAQELADADRRRRAGGALRAHSRERAGRRRGHDRRRARRGAGLAGRHRRLLPARRELVTAAMRPRPDLQRRSSTGSDSRPGAPTRSVSGDIHSAVLAEPGGGPLTVLLAELNVRHTRRHMPTRRVAVDDGYLPTSGPAFGGVLLGAVIAEHVPGLDEEQFDALDRLVDGGPRRPHGAAHRAAVPAPDRHPRPRPLPPPDHRRRGRTGIGAPDPRARPPRPAGAAGDRRADGGGRAPAVGAPSVAFRFVDAAAGAPGGPARGSRGPAHATRACPGCGRSRRPARARSTGLSAAGPTSGAACRRSGAGRWRCSACARACRRARRRAEALPAPRPPRPPRPRRRQCRRRRAHRRAHRGARAPARRHRVDHVVASAGAGARRVVSSGRCAADPVHVTVTGAAGQIGYALVHRIASGQLLGPDQPVVLRLLEIEPAMKALEGVVMELDDGAHPLLVGIEATSDLKTAFDGASWALLVGSIPRKAGMERGDLLKSTAGSSSRRARRSTTTRRRRARARRRQPVQHQLPDRPVSNAPDVPADRWFAMTRLDENRAKTQLAKKAGVQNRRGHERRDLGQPLGDAVPRLRARPDRRQAGARGDRRPRLARRVRSSRRCRSAAPRSSRRGARRRRRRRPHAAIDSVNSVHRDARRRLALARGEQPGEYGMPEGLQFGYPVRSDGSSWSVVEGIEHDDFARARSTSPPRSSSTSATRCATSVWSRGNARGEGVVAGVRRRRRGRGFPPAHDPRRRRHGDLRRPRDPAR